MKANRIALVAALALTSALGISTRTAAQSAPQKSQVQRVVDSLARAFTMDKANGAPGVSIAVVRGNDTVVMKGYGMADLENDVPATPQTVYRIGSITKQFTSAAVMQLVQDGKVKLDDSIGTYLPTLPVAWRGATVRQFLNHTSGVPSYTDIGARWTKRWGEAMTPDTIVAITANDTLWFKPGTSWRYDNTGYVVLGMLVEKVTGHPWATELENRIFKPLGLASTENCLASPLIKHRAQGYAPVKGEWTNAQYLEMTQPYAAGALCSTVGDLAKWDRALGTGQVVTPASYTQMTTPEGAASRGRLKYGFGLSKDTLAGHPVIRHSGGINGFISDNAWFPDEQMSVTVLSNSGAGRSDYLLANVARAVHGVPLVTTPPRAAVSSAQRLARYAGVYALMLNGQAHDFTFTVKDSVLMSQLEGQDAFPVTPAGENTFSASFDPSVKLVFTMEGDRATKVTLYQGGATYEGARKP